ncbi:MAG: hypothetical protein MUC93_04230 [Bacteroidales bacterium]|nr:hypothetical protein [Bacteroidales bacterium]
MEQAGGSFSHQLINPADPDLITCNPLPDTQNDNSLPMEKRPRTRIINIKNGTNEPFLITPYGGSRCKPPARWQTSLIYFTVTPSGSRRTESVEARYKKKLAVALLKSGYGERRRREGDSNPRSVG